MPAKIKTAGRDLLGAEELRDHGRAFYTPGVPYQWVLSFGWVVVGFYVRHETPLKIMVAHANYYQNAGKTHAQLALEGGTAGATSWRYMSTRLISDTAVLHVGEYFGRVPRGPVQS